MYRDRGGAHLEKKIHRERTATVTEMSAVAWREELSEGSSDSEGELVGL